MNKNQIPEYKIVDVKEISPKTDRFHSLLAESDQLAQEEGISIDDLREMDGINKMRLIAEAINSEHYIFFSGSKTP